MQLPHSKIKIAFLFVFSQPSLAKNLSIFQPQNQLETYTSVDEELDALIAMEPEELLTVVVGSKGKENWKKAPRVITVVTKKDIQSY